MRTLIKLGVTCVGALALVFPVGVWWVYYYTYDMPDIGALSRYVPTTVTQVSDGCLGKSVAIPYDVIGANLKSALNAAEVREDDPSVLTTIYEGFTSQNQIHRATLSFQISRAMFCTPSKQLHRQIVEVRTATQIERRFSPREVFTIYVNRGYFDESVIGVQAAAQHFFQKDPSELDISQAALLAGMLKAPSLYSPFKHAERALQRRNELIDGMIANGSISSKDGETAKSNPLNVRDNVRDGSGLSTQITKTPN
jgi:membrane peptidoglycan carboxypeptidase